MQRALTLRFARGQAQILAGRRLVEVPGATLGEVLANLAVVVPALVGHVVEADGQLTRAYMANLNGMRFLLRMDEGIKAADAVLILSSLSGGAE